MRRLFSYLLPTRRAVFWFSVPIVSFAVFLWWGIEVLEPDVLKRQLLDIHRGPDGMYTAHGTGTAEVHVFREQNLYAVVRGHHAEVHIARFEVHAEQGLLLRTRDVAGNAARTRLDHHARLPVWEREHGHIDWVHRNLWRPVGQPAANQGRAVIRWASAMLTPPPPPPKVNEPFRDPDCDACPDMMVIPGGTFLMGSPESETGRFDSEGPQRQVSVAAFAIAKHEVTFAEWQACVNGEGCQGNPNPDDRGWGRADRPVIGVSWLDAEEYVTWLNTQVPGSPYRLPSEAEWEYAARAQEAGEPYTRFHWGDDPNASDQCAFANGYHEAANCRDGFPNTAPVGSFASNRWGLHDMSGNVWEWVQDCWHESYQNAPVDETPWLEANGGVCDTPVLRGGSWGDGPRVLRSAIRSWSSRGYRSITIGFRLARTLSE